MINGMILNQSIYNESNNEDFEIQLALENVMLKQIIIHNMLNNEEYVNESVITESIVNQKLVSTYEIKYAFKKFREKKRGLSEIEKDLKNCDKVLESIDKKLKKYEGKPKVFKIADNIVKILLLLFPYTFIFQSHHLPETDGLDKRDTSARMTLDGKLDSQFEYYKKDLLLCKKETEATKKFLLQRKAVLEKQK